MADFLRSPLVLLSALAISTALPLRAQEPPDTLLGWSGEADVGASIFFGNTEQKIVSSRASVTRTERTTELTGEAQFNYGEATGPAGDPFVTKRSWLARATSEYRPFNAVSPYGLASVESSFEKRIDARYRLGAGARVNAVSTPRTTVEGSAAILGETTRFDEGAEPAADDELVRWSAGLRVQRSMAEESLVFRSDTSYRPEFAELGRFTLSTTSSLSYSVSNDLSLKLTFIDEYDSEAEDRGAESNNDGQIVFGLLSTF